MAALLGPCPHCGAQHEAHRLRCPEVGEPLPLRGRLLDGKFRLLRELGSGGMATVWLARNEHVEREFALKLLSPDVVNYGEVNERFRKEARAAGRIGSPHICEVLDFAEGPLGPYIVMEYLRGSDFGQVLDLAGRLDPGIAVRIVRLALNGLAAAHAAGVIHRDLKPGNIFLQRTEDGLLNVKLMDFGVSKFQTADAQKHVTGTGFLLGTPEYMAPEQLAGSRDIDATVDVFSTGAVLYRALSGDRLFSGAEIGEVIRKAANHDFVPLAELAPHLAPGLVEVVSRCLERDRGARYQSAAELSEALRPFEADDAQWSAWVRDTKVVQEDASKVTREIDIVVPIDPTGPSVSSHVRAASDEAELSADGSEPSSVVSLTAHVSELSELADAPTGLRRTDELMAGVPVAVPPRPESAAPAQSPPSSERALVPARPKATPDPEVRSAWMRLGIAGMLLAIGVVSVVWIATAHRDGASSTAALDPTSDGEHDSPRTAVSPDSMAPPLLGQGGAAATGHTTAGTDAGDMLVVLDDTAGDTTAASDDSSTGDEGTDGGTTLDLASTGETSADDRDPTSLAAIGPGSSNVSYRRAHDVCRRLANIRHRGREDWHVPALSEAQSVLHGFGVAEAWYWTQNRAGSRRVVVRVPTGRTRSMGQSRRRARVLCVSGNSP